MLAALYYKHPNIEGISAKWLDDKIVIHKWPSAAGPQPTEAQLAGYITEYQAHLNATAHQEARDKDIRAEDMFALLEVLINKIDGAPGADAEFTALKTRLENIRTRHPSP